MLVIAPFYREIEHFIKGVVNKVDAFPENIIALFNNHTGVVTLATFFICGKSLLA